MPALRVFNLTRQTILVERGGVARNIWQRVRGLMGVRELRAGDGLILRGEQAIHTFGMKIAIDVVYLDARGIVLRVIPAMPPSRLGPFIWRARDVLELPAGTLERGQTREGDQLKIELV